MMSDKLILTPEHFSVESGFVEGVVVQITTDDGLSQVEFFNRIGEDYITCTNPFVSCPPEGEYDEMYNPILYAFDEIKSISVLSGPVRFWSNAPAGATYCMENRETGRILFDSLSGMEPDLSSDSDLFRVTRRPFWADFGKGE